MQISASKQNLARSEKCTKCKNTLLSYLRHCNTLFKGPFYSNICAKYSSDLSIMYYQKCFHVAVLTTNYYTNIALVKCSFGHLFCLIILVLSTKQYEENIKCYLVSNENVEFRVQHYLCFALTVYLFNVSDSRCFYTSLKFHNGFFVPFVAFS